MRIALAILLATAVAIPVAAQMTRDMPTPGASVQKLPSGLAMEDVRVGKGAIVEKGSPIRVLYTGWLTKTGRPFDSRMDRARPLVVYVGAGKLIKGFEDGVIGMRVGGKRRLFIPAKLAYGKAGAPRIPPNSDLTFEIELVGVAKKIQ